MSGPAGLNLSGEWRGVFSYPAALPPVSFIASLAERAGRIAGAVDEASRRGNGPPRKLSATIEGRRAGLAVTWLKLYDDISHGYDAVTYEGSVSADGQEICGRWSIFGDGSGVFLMTRQTSVAARRERRASARL